MVQHVPPQQVVVPGVLPGHVREGEREVAVSVQTGRDPQRVRREITFIHVLALHVEDAILGRRHVKAFVGQRPELPVTAVVVLGHPFGDAVNDRFQLQWKGHPEESLDDNQTLIFRNELPGDR